MTRDVERECHAYLRSLHPLEPSIDELVLFRLSFLGGVAAALRLLAADNAEDAPAPLLAERLSLEVMELVEQAAGVRP